MCDISKTVIGSTHAENRLYRDTAVQRPPRDVLFTSECFQPSSGGKRKRRVGIDRGCIAVHIHGPQCILVKSGCCA